MKYAYLTNIPLDQAVADYLAFLDDAGMSAKEEKIPVQEALWRITSRAIYAQLCSPHYIASAMDGIAVMASRTFGATETTPVRLSAEDYVRVDTGDPIPQGCDAVVMIEDVVEDGEEVMLYAAATPWQHIRQIGEDICAGDMLLPSYSEITPGAMGAMLAGGVLEVSVMKRPVVGILPTGDEIVPPTASPSPGDIIEFNGTIFSGMLAQWGAVARQYPIVKDRENDIREMVVRAVSECDAVLLCAGTSAGRDDYTRSILQELGQVLYHGIAIKPGKPAVLARIGAKPVVGIPGYPVSGIVVMEQLCKPFIMRLLGKQGQMPQQIEVALSKKVNSSLKYREFVRARLCIDETGAWKAIPLNRGAGVVTSFVKADCMLDIPQDSEGISAGGMCRATLLRSRTAIENTLGIIGSHDPMLDEAADILKRRHPSFSISSSHVGSMGAILAVKRKEALLGGIHLLDEQSGTYNNPYLRRFFPEGGVLLVSCMQRVQGLMVAKGNPLGIGEFADITRVRYVNRQKDSGTRILCDYLMKTQGVKPQEVLGYEREETTHTAVAAQIAAGTADAGLGILAAAKIYNLDFLPLCNEQYDLLLRKQALENPLVQMLLDVMKSAEFTKRMLDLGGYIPDHPGELRPL